MPEKAEISEEMKIVIIEDEALAAAKLEKMLLQLDAQIEVQAKISSVEEAVEWFQENSPPDLAFLDIQLSDGTSFDIVKQVGLNFPVIFVTAYDEYALEAFKLHSVAYLLKPVTNEKLMQALDKLEEMRAAIRDEAEGESKMKELIHLLSREKHQYKSRFLVRLGNMIRSVKKEEIAYFFAEDKLVFLATHDNQKLPVSMTLDHIEQQLDPAEFFRVNRQYIVHIDATSGIYPYFKGRLKLQLSPTPGEDVVVSSSRAPLFKAWLDQ